MTDISVATYSLTSGDNGSQVSIVFSDGSTETITDQHANFTAIAQALVNKPEGYGPVVYELANIAKTVGRKFKNLSSRVTTDGSELFFDGDPIDNSLAEYILKLLREDAQKAASFFEGKAEDADEETSQITWEALVKFLELLYANPNPQSRESLYNFISRYGLTIRKDGHFIAYKGLQEDFGSINKGYGIVDDVEVNGTLFNRPGSVLRFPRKDVNSNTGVGCAQGLHAGTHAYASNWAQGKLVAVAINPTNVVSVPDDCTFQKIRVCEYEILNEVDPLKSAVATSGWESSSSYWDSNSSSDWDDDYGTDRSYDEAIDDIREADVISFDYVALDGREQKVSEAQVEELDFDQLKAFVPAKNGYRSFKFSGISNLVILDDEAEEEDDRLEDEGSEDTSEESSESSADAAEDAAPTVESGRDFFEKISATLSGGANPAEILKGFESFSETFEKRLKDNLANVDVAKVASAEDIAEVKRIVREDLVGGKNLFEGIFGRVTGGGEKTENPGVPESEIDRSAIEEEFAKVKVGERISFTLAGSDEVYKDARVLFANGRSLTVQLSGVTGYKAFSADDLVTLNRS